MPKVSFFNADVPFVLKSKKKLSRFLQEIFLREQQILGKLDIVFCSDNYLLKINKEYLSHDFYTDIITFDLSDSTDEIIGDIYISTDRVKENALALKKVFYEEMLRVIFHGCLHLCGFCDKKKSEITIMRDREDFYLHLYDNFIKMQNT